MALKGTSNTIKLSIKVSIYWHKAAILEIRDWSNLFLMGIYFKIENLALRARS